MYVVILIYLLLVYKTLLEYPVYFLRVVTIEKPPLLAQRYNKYIHPPNKRDAKVKKTDRKGLSNWRNAELKHGWYLAREGVRCGC